MKKIYVHGKELNDYYTVFYENNPFHNTKNNSNPVGKTFTLLEAAIKTDGTKPYGMCLAVDSQSRYVIEREDTKGVQSWPSCKLKEGKPELPKKWYPLISVRFNGSINDREFVLGEKTINKTVRNLEVGRKVYHQDRGDIGTVVGLGRTTEPDQFSKFKGYELGADISYKESN